MGPQLPERARRLAWFIGLYLVTLIAFAAFVYGFRALIPR
jgi:hypothetical protein